MTMSTQTLAESARLLGTLLVDQLQIFDVGEPVTEGIQVTRPTTPVVGPVPGLVQLVAQSDTIEGVVENPYTVKVEHSTPLRSGQAVLVISCQADPSMVGKMLLVDKVSASGLNMIRRGVAQDFEYVQPQGKAGI